MINLLKINNYLVGIKGIALYPIVTLLIFTTFFGLMLYLVFKADKKKLDQNAHIPLDND